MTHFLLDIAFASHTDTLRFWGERQVTRRWPVSAKSTWIPFSQDHDEASQERVCYTLLKYLF